MVFGQPNLKSILTAQRDAFLRDGPPSLQVRRDQLTRLGDQLIRYQDEIIQAISDDFGNRSPQETLIGDIGNTLKSIGHARKNLKRWMAPKRMQIEPELRPGSGRVHYQPLGVIGIISPWNYPVFLALSPLVGALAAGNRVMIKPSELTPNTSTLLKALIAETFRDDEVMVVPGGPQVAQEFSSLKFDHLLFTGSTNTGRKVMAAAAENLVPVTLELGGKSPAILGADYAVVRAARRIAFGKFFNAGQTCIAPDYCLVPETLVEPFAKALRKSIVAMYPTLLANPDYTSIISEDHYGRLLNLLSNAKERGAQIVKINPADEALVDARKIAPTLVLKAADNMKVMDDEIFGPILPILPYKTIDDAIAFINARPRPLAIYHFSKDKTERHEVLSRTTSGGVTLNDTLLHVSAESLPFGGVGDSGMGNYHGWYGFRTFSHEKAVFQQTLFNGAKLLRPPYGLMARLITRKLVPKKKQSKAA